MTDDAPVWPVSSEALATAMALYRWSADIALGKLSPAEADAMRRLREEMEADLRQLSVALSTIAPQASAEIEECVARLLYTAGRIWQLHPVPTPNSRKSVQGR